MARNRRTSEKKEMDFELNLASIIDCFTVLITYLLVSASFITLGMLDVSVASPALTQTPPSNDGPSDVTVSIEMAPGQKIEVHTSGEEKRTYRIPASEGTWNFAKMTEILKQLQQRFPKIENATVSADDSIEYKDVVKAVQEARNSLKHIALGTDQIGQWAE